MTNVKDGNEQKEHGPDIPVSDRLMLSADEAAMICGLSRSTWLKLRATGEVPPPVKLGGSVRWHRPTLDQWAASGCPTWDIFKQKGGHHGQHN